MINKFYTEYIDKNKNEIIEHLKDEIEDSYQGQTYHGIFALILTSVLVLFMIISLFFDYNRNRLFYYLPMVFFIIYEFLIGLYLIYNAKKIDKHEDATKEWILTNLNLTINGSVDNPYLSKFILSLIIGLITIINVSIIFSSTLVLILITLVSSIFIVIWISWVTFIPKSKITENYLIIRRRFLKKKRNINWKDILSIQIKTKIIRGRTDSYTLFYLEINLRQVEPIKIFSYKRPFKLFLGYDRDSLLVNIIKEFFWFMSISVFQQEI